MMIASVAVIVAPHLLFLRVDFLALWILKVCWQRYEEAFFPRKHLLIRAFNHWHYWYIDIASKKQKISTLLVTSKWTSSAIAHIVAFIFINNLIHKFGDVYQGQTRYSTIMMKFNLSVRVSEWSKFVNESRSWWIFHFAAYWV